MKHAINTHHREHLKAIGISDPPKSIEIPEAEYDDHCKAWETTLPNASPEDIHKRVLGHHAWKQHRVTGPVPVMSLPTIHHAPKWERWLVIGLLLLIALLLFKGKAHAQFSHVNYVNWQQGGSNIAGAFFTFPFSINCGTNVTCSVSGSTLTLTASSSASTAWSAITGSATNTNTGFVLAPTATGTVPWIHNCPSGISVDCYDWELNSTKEMWIDSAGVVHFAQSPVGAGGGTPCTTTALSLQYNNGGAFGCVAQFTYSGSTLTGASGTLDLAGMTLVRLRAGAGATSSVNGDIPYDSTANVWHIWQNGADKRLIASSNLGSAGQVAISNADGSSTFADPIVSANQPAATAQTITATGALTGVTVSADGTVLVTVSGTYAGVAFNFEGSPDGTFSPAFPVTASAVDAVSTVTASGALGSNATKSWFVKVAGHTKFRLNVTAYTSGTANVTITPVYYQLSDGGNVNVANFPATQPISAVSLPLPTGAAADSSLTTIDTDLKANVTLHAGANVIGHVIDDSGSTTAVTGNVAVTKADGSDVTLGAKADAKSTATDTTAITAMQVFKEISAMEQAPASRAVTNTGTFAVQAAATEADGANTTLGAKADAKSTATDTTAVSIMSVLKEISALEQAPASQAVTNTGTFAVQAAESGTWTVQPGNTANTTPWLATINQGGNSASVNGSGQLSVNCAAGCSGSSPAQGTFNLPPNWAIPNAPVSLANGANSNLQLDSFGRLITIGAYDQQILAALQTVPPKAAAPLLGTFNRRVTSTGDALDVNVKYGNPCNNPALLRNLPISQTANAQIFSSETGKAMLCGVFVMGADAENVSLVAGTGTTCATGTAAIIGGATAANGPNMAANGGFVVPFPIPLPPVNVCLFQSGSGRVSGTMVVALYQ